MQQKEDLMLNISPTLYVSPQIKKKIQALNIYFTYIYVILHLHDWFGWASLGQKCHGCFFYPIPALGMDVFIMQLCNRVASVCVLFAP